MSQPDKLNGMEIAVIGMAGRFPQAADLDAFWQNLKDATNCISFFSDKELEAEGVDRATLEDRNYVKAGGVLQDADLFDASFFGYNAREAEITDPQQRVFLECAWEALENAGYTGGNYKQLIGVYGGVSSNTYLFNLLTNPDVMKSAGGFQITVASDKDFLAPRVAYKLNLKGPAVVVQTACSTSLVAIHMACQSLLAGECQMALAGGVSITFPQTIGYIYQEGGISAPDGLCRAFDAQSRGTVQGRGAGIVVLKRLEDALADGDHIRAVIKGSAINNDGAFKVGFTAPGLEGQTNVVQSAQGVAEVDPETITYIEAHGTATELGDPVEVLALTRAFRTATAKKSFCAIGSVKSNIGHTDAAAGVAGFIKTVLALEHRQIPATLHFERPNPKIEFDNSPFYVNARLTEWPANGVPRRAGVSSFGIGGTNAHLILEEAPAAAPSGPSRPNQLLVLSAKTPNALERITDNLAAHLRKHPEQSLADIAYTTQLGREAFAYRRILVCRDHETASSALEGRDPLRVLSLHKPDRNRPVVFLFPGQGTQYAGMTMGLYHQEPTFRQCVDDCALRLMSSLGSDVRETLYPAADRVEEAGELLRKTALAQPALFVVEYALARLWQEWGVRPQAMIGHSIGEYVAATLAGIMSLDEALMLVATRGSLMQALPAGAMLAVPLPENELLEFLHDGLSLAAVNGPAISVVSGPTQSIDALEVRLAARKINGRRLHTSHAFHSQMMDPMLEAFTQRVGEVRFQPPQIPIISNLNGHWMTNDQATDLAYWTRHLREAVRFGEGLSTIFQDPERILLEVGPGSTLSRLAGSHTGKPKNMTAVASLPNAGDHTPDGESLIGTLGRLWLAGVEIEWDGFYRHECRHRLPLPTYPFERRKYWVGASPTKFIGTAVQDDSSPVQAEPCKTRREDPFPVRANHPRPEMPVAYISPRDDRERRLCAIWEELLGIGPIGIHDNFFELGGHSLLATRMVNSLREVFGLEFALRRIFETPTVAELAVVVAAHQANPKEANQELIQLPVVVPDPVNRLEPFPLTDVQQAYWIGRTGAFELGQVATHSYLEFEGTELDLNRYGLAWQRLIDRHGMLRAIVRSDGQQQILEDLPPYRIETLDLRSATRESAEAKLLGLRRTMSHQVRPADQWPLFEVRASLIPGGVIRIHISFDLLIGDAWSWNILMFELFHFYQNPELPLPPLELSFRDYVLGEVALQQTAIYQRALEYWMARLDSIPPAPELPLRKSLASIEHPVFKRRSHQLPEEQWSRLKKRAVTAGLTPSGILVAAFAEALAVWCRSPRLTINLTLFNRLPLHPEVDRLIGDFTSLTLLAADCAEPVSFEERARKLQRLLLDDLDHRYVSAVRVMRELARHQPGGARAMMPVVFTSTLAIDESRQDSMSLSALGEVIYSISQTPQVMLDHQVGQHEGCLVFNWDAVEEAFPAGLLDDLFGAYCDLLRRLVEDESVWWSSSLGLVPAAQVEQRAAINAVTAPVPAEMLQTAFARMAQTQPEQPAVIWSGGALSYGELDKLSNQLARRLRRLGARPEKLVAVSMEKGWEQVVAVLAILRAGGAYLPVDPGLPQERRFFLLQHSDVELAIACTASRLEWPDGVRPIYVDDPSLKEEDDQSLESAQGPSDLAYVIFTSGSTGLPKGVMIDHRGALNTVLDVNRRHRVGPGDRVLALSALSFDLSVYDIFGPLSAGGAIVIPDAGKLREPAHWATLMAESRVTIWDSVPALMQMEVDYLEGCGARLPSSLRLVMLSGDWLPVTLPDRIRRIGDAIQVISMGGATEASIWSIDYPIHEVDPSWPSIPYGRPMDNQTFHVLNPRLEPCPTWTPGDLYIGGIGLARGYWKDDEKTRASFITHPVTGECLYRTGDMGRWLPDGNIEFLGREDFQVKIQGYRVELGEIELALAQHPDVKLAIAAAIGQSGGARRLVAYVVFEREDGASLEELRGFLREKLPDYMVPSSIVPLNSLPLTANGKVDRAALPSPDRMEQLATEEKFAEPRDEVERELCGIWEEVLDARQVGLGASFFELGGHSLLAVQLISRIRKALGVELPVRAIFEAPTVGAMAERIRRERRRHVGLRVTRSPLVPLKSSGSKTPLFFVHGAGGSAFAFTELARQLDTDRPLFAFHDTDMGEFNTLECSIESIAMNYVAALQTVQPAGPYLLGGWSMGGLVAFEMARHLQAQDQVVALLALVDSYLPASDSKEEDELILWSFLLTLGLSQDDAKDITCSNESLEARFAAAEQLMFKLGLSPSGAAVGLNNLFHIYRKHVRAAEKFRPQRANLNVHLWQASERRRSMNQQSADWKKCATTVSASEVPGNHFSLLHAPHVGELAKQLSVSLDRASEAPPSQAGLRRAGTGT